MPQLFGTWIKPRDFGSGLQTHQQAVLALEAQIGRKVTLDHSYQHMPVDLPTSDMTWAASGGRIPLLAWDPGPYWTWTQVAQGAADSYIDTQANNLKAWGQQCWLNFSHEPENDIGMGTSDDFRNAYNRTVDRFNAIYVPNVTHVVCLISWTITSRKADAWLPSKADIIAADGYNYNNVKPLGKYRNLADIFTPALQFACSHHKPFAVLETGTTVIAGDPKGWMERALSFMQKNEDNIIAFVYFSSDNAYPWWHDESPEKLAGFKELAQGLA